MSYIVGGLVCPRKQNLSNIIKITSRPHVCRSVAKKAISKTRVRVILVDMLSISSCSGNVRVIVLELFPRGAVLAIQETEKR